MIQIPELQRTPIDFCRELYSNEGLICTWDSHLFHITIEKLI